MRVLLDTNAYSALFRGDAAVSELVARGAQDPPAGGIELPLVGDLEAELRELADVAREHRAVLGHPLESG